MDYRHLGRTGLKVSPLCLGTMNFGPQTTEPDSQAIMDQALAVGINFFDTANVYGGKRGAGITESILGRWFAQGGSRREQVVLATKGYGDMSDAPNALGLGARNLKLSCEASLRRLQTEYIDLYQMHHIDRTTPWDEIWQAMEQLVREGKVLYIGSSNFAAWDLATANQIATRRHFLGLVSEQSKYSLATRTIELEVIPCCRSYGIGLIPYSPLDGGLLGGALAQNRAGRRGSEQIQERVAKHRPQLEAYEALCKELKEEPAHVALAWLRHNPVVTAPIIGPRTLDQLTGSLRVLQLELDAATLKKLDEIWPGPGGEAPQAYAW